MNTGSKPLPEVVLKILPDAQFSSQRTTSGKETTTCHSAYAVRQPNGSPGEMLLDIIDSKADYWNKITLQKHEAGSCQPC